MFSLTDYDEDDIRDVPHDGASRSFQDQMGYRHVPRPCDPHSFLEDHRGDAWIRRALVIIIVVALALGTLAYVKHIDARTAANVERNIREMPVRNER